MFRGNADRELRACFWVFGFWIWFDCLAWYGLVWFGLIHYGRVRRVHYDYDYDYYWQVAYESTRVCARAGREERSAKVVMMMVVRDLCVLMLSTNFLSETEKDKRASSRVSSQSSAKDPGSFTGKVDYHDYYDDLLLRRLLLRLALLLLACMPTYPYILLLLSSIISHRFRSNTDPHLSTSSSSSTLLPPHLHLLLPLTLSLLPLDPSNS